MKSNSVKTKTLLSIEDLSVTLYTDKVTVCPVNTVNYSVESGKVLAIVGESGSGKTVMNMAPLGLLPQGVTVDVEGSVIVTFPETLFDPRNSSVMFTMVDIGCPRASTLLPLAAEVT